MRRKMMKVIATLCILFHAGVFCMTEEQDELPITTLTVHPSTTLPPTTLVNTLPQTLETSVNVEDVIKKALEYLISRRQADWGWGNHTHKVITALRLANTTSKDTEHQSLEMQLSAKQMEIEILLMLSKHHESPPPLERLAAYSLALGALCRDPRTFHGKDLVATLLHRDPSHDYDFAYATLAACSSAAHVRRRHIRRLLDIANAAIDHNLDTISMVILALRCIVQDHRHRSLQPFIRRPMAGLARQQQSDGNFGGVSTTALAIQALEELEPSGGSHHQWSPTAARNWLASSALPTGGWGNVPQTASAVIALAPGHLASLASVRAPRCPDKLSDSRHDALEGNGSSDASLGVLAGDISTGDPNSKNVSFTYTLWVGANVTENYTLNMVTPKNISFFQVMQMAAELNPKFKFAVSDWPNGHYVHTLAGHREEPMSYHYWLLYRVGEVPDPTSPPGNQLVAPAGVDELLVDEGYHYLFWYKKL